MALGDQADFAWRISRMLPQEWYGEIASDPVVSAFIAGLAWVQSQVWSWVVYVRAQGRIATASGQNLDDICRDFLGYRISRNTGESDDAFRMRFKREILRPRATRAALLQAVRDATGYPGVLVEPRNPQDCGGYATLSEPGVGGGLAYASSTTGAAGAGAWGSLRLPYQAFLTCYRPPLSAVPEVTGYASLTEATGCAAGGYGTLAAPAANEGAVEWTSLATMQGSGDAAVYAAIASVLPAGCVVWTRLVDQPPTAGDRLDVNFYANESVLQ